MSSSKQVFNSSDKKNLLTRNVTSFLIEDILHSPPRQQPPLLPPAPSYFPHSSLYGLYCAAVVATGQPPEAEVETGRGSGQRKSRRNRTVFTESQLMGLERRFDSQKYLSTPDRAELARILGLTQLQVKTWYQNRRMKWKKQVLSQGCPVPPTKPKGRPKKNSIPSFGQLMALN